MTRYLALALLGLFLSTFAQAQQTSTEGGPNGIACAYNASPSTLTSGQAGWIQCDSTGHLAIGSSGTPSGSVGHDYSVNPPTWPNVGAAFGATGPFANWVLACTIPVNPTRNNYNVWNSGGAQLLLLRDDGTAAPGAAPVNATGYVINSGSSAYQQGGADSDQSFKGRIQVFTASSATWVSCDSE